ncbi:MAG: hypothetical protein ACXVH7_04930, partial [Thermoanaerobaculia bacterium]
SPRLIVLPIVRLANRGAHEVVHSCPIATRDRAPRDAPSWGRARSSAFRRTGATGEAYCLAHHVTVNGDKRR